MRPKEQAKRTAVSFKNRFISACVGAVWLIRSTMPHAHTNATFFCVCLRMRVMRRVANDHILSLVSYIFWRQFTCIIAVMWNGRFFYSLPLFSYSSRYWFQFFKRVFLVQHRFSIDFLVNFTKVKVIISIESVKLQIWKISKQFRQTWNQRRKCHTWKQYG